MNWLRKRIFEGPGKIYTLKDLGENMLTFNERKFERVDFCFQSSRNKKIEASLFQEESKASSNVMILLSGNKGNRSSSLPLV